MEKSREEFRNEIIRDFNKSMKKWDAAKQELENDPVWQEMQKWVTIDWNDGREKLLESGVSITDIFGTEEWTLEIQDHCFVRNFPTLKVKAAHLTDCIFANCDQITLEEGTAVRCVFAEVETIFLDNMKVYDSVFRDLSCDCGGFIISMEDSSLSGCKFFDISVDNDNYLADGVGDCLIEKCSFERISTSREDRELFTCSDTKGKIIRRKCEYDMVDHDSCSGLELVTDQFGAIIIGSFETYIEDEDDDE